MSDLAVGLFLFAFLMVAYWLVRILGGEARDYMRRTARADGDASTRSSEVDVSDPAAVASHEVTSHVTNRAGAGTGEEPRVVVVQKTAAPSVDSAIVDIALQPAKPLAATTPIDPVTPAAPASVDILKPAAPVAPAAGHQAAPDPIRASAPVRAPEPVRVPEPARIQEPTRVSEPARIPESVRVEVIRDAPAPQTASAKAAEPVRTSTVPVIAAAATVVAAAVAKAAATPAATAAPAALRADARGTLPPGYLAQQPVSAPKRFDDAAISLPPGYQRAVIKTTIAPTSAPLAAPIVQQTKFEPLPPIKPIPLSAPPPGTGPSPVVPADWRNTVSASYQRPIITDAPRGFSIDPIALPAHYARAHWRSTLSPESRAALPPEVAPAAAPAAPVAPVTTAPATVAPVTAAAVAAPKAAPIIPAPIIDETSPYTTRASILPRSDATPVAPMPAARPAAPSAAAPAAVEAAPAAMASPSAASVLVSTARRGTRVVGADVDGDDAIDLLAVNPPRPQTPSIWDTATPRRSVSDDANFAADVLPAGGGQLIKGERIPVRAETLLVRPDVSSTLSPAVAPAVVAKPATAPVTAQPPRPAPPGAGYSTIKPTPADRPLVSTSSGTAGSHAISQVHMGAEPAKPAIVATPSVGATLPPGALGDD